MGFNPGSVLSAVADRLLPPPGRRQRHYWTGRGRAHIEVKGVDSPGNADFARRVEQDITRLKGVHWAEVNAVLGRVVVAFDDDQVDVDGLIEVIEGVEEACGVDTERFPADRPDHPADAEAVLRQMYAIGAEIAGLGVALVGRAIRADPVLAEIASAVSLADATPAVHRTLEPRLGRAATDLGLAVSSAVAQGLAQGPFGLLVDIAHRSLRLDEARAQLQAWQRREPELHEQPEGNRVPALSGTPRPAPLPPGPVESYADRAAAAGLVAGAATGSLTRDLRTIVAATASATPKAARLGREGFAAWLDRELARSGVLAMDSGALRRLDRVDTVVLDARVLVTGRAVLGTVWLPPGAKREADQVRMIADDLLDPAAPAEYVQRGGWVLAPAGRKLPGAAGKAVRRLRAPGCHVLGLHRDGTLAGLVVTEPELDPHALNVVSVARLAGLVVVAERRSSVGERVHADRVVPGGKRLAMSVRALQSDGHGVAVVSSGTHEALTAADVGIGIPGGSRPPWGAHLITGTGLADAYRILQAIPAAHAMSRRAAMLAAYGTGVGALLALSGPRAGAARRAMVGVNGAAVASLGTGLWTARARARLALPAPAPATKWHAIDADTVLTELDSSRHGLDDAEASRRRTRQPTSREPAEPGVLRASAEELANPLTPALAGGAGLSAASGSVVDAALIGTVMLADALVSGVQRVGAHRALRRLTDESAIEVRLRRGGSEDRTTADRLVAGDVIALQAGDAVPADCRILYAQGVETDESSLTGESQLVQKSADPTGAASVADRSSMLYAGTAVAAGTAEAVVVAVGPMTELGRSAEAGRTSRRPSGVQERLGQLTRTTVPISFGAGAAVIAGDLLRGQPVSRSLGTGVSLAVASVPEGLPLVATVAELSTARRLSRRNALVRNPGTIEALGRVDVLCFDKTGTLTEGRITLHTVWAAGGDQPEPLGALSPHGRDVLAAALRASPEHRNGEPMAYPADRAVVVGGKAAEVSVELGTDGWQQVAELPFESSRGYHAVLGQTASGFRLAVKGAPETALQRAGRVAAVTGDGANDAPAIRLADVGVALGQRGTNAAKEAADVVVTDDRIETIIDAIVEGRAMWSSVRDAISVLLGGNLGEIAFTLGTALLLPGGSPLNARQLLLVNLLTDMAPSMALAVRPPGSATLKTLLTEGPDVSLGSALTRDVVMSGALTSSAGAANDGRRIAWHRRYVRS